jgi:ABC-type tungstate transport system substrate-binding protein
MIPSCFIIQARINLGNELMRCGRLDEAAGQFRTVAEVGAAMMLGGNIQGSTRTMTTAIALETNKGNFELAMAIGILLLLIAFTANYILNYMQQK